MEKNYILFLDNISRTILATLVSEDTNNVSVINPVALQVVSDQQNKMKVQLVPLLLRDLLKDPNENVVWTYHAADITRSNITSLNERFLNQYDFVVGLTPEKASKLAQERKGGPTDAPVVKLFDGAKQEEQGDKANG